MLLFPVVLKFKAFSPIAVLLHPVVLLGKVEYPKAVLWFPVVLACKENFPIAIISRQIKSKGLKVLITQEIDHYSNF